jgi:hypothetical protein
MNLSTKLHSIEKVKIITVYLQSICRVGGIVSELML